MNLNKLYIYGGIFFVVMLLIGFLSRVECDNADTIGDIAWSVYTKDIGLGFYNGYTTVTDADVCGDSVVIYHKNTYTYPRIIFKKIYRIKSGKLVLDTTIYAKIIPAQEERVEW